MKGIAVRVGVRRAGEVRVRVRVRIRVRVRVRVEVRVRVRVRGGVWYGGEDERGLAVHSEDGMLHVLSRADEELRDGQGKSKG